MWFGDSRDDETLDWLERLPFTLVFVCGNHENYDALARYPVAEWRGGKVHRVRPHVLHLMRNQCAVEIHARNASHLVGQVIGDRRLQRKEADQDGDEQGGQAAVEQLAYQIGAHGQAAAPDEGEHLTVDGDAGPPQHEGGQNKLAAEGAVAGESPHTGGDLQRSGKQTLGPLRGEAEGGEHRPQHLGQPGQEAGADKELNHHGEKDHKGADVQRGQKGVFDGAGKADVEKITSLPIVGDVPLSEDKGKEESIVVHENQNDLMAETFRNVRTNVLYMMRSDEKVILVTSTTTGEGKTFIASNLAVSLALLGKKIVIVGLDIRKPSLNKAFNLSHREQGISQFLANPEHTDLMSLVQVSRINANLSILPGGPIPPNPTELVARESLPQAIDILKKHFDYIILDTAPIGMVTDTQLISRVANASIYVCRADYTHKADYTLINELSEQKKLPNLCTLINGLNMKKKKYGYYYGYGKYGKYYGYGKKYGYGYGYGTENVNKK